MVNICDSTLPDFYYFGLLYQIKKVLTDFDQGFYFYEL